MSAPRRIIIDTDPGRDDAVAILLALASADELEILALTTVAGNVPLERTTQNALNILNLARRTDVPVYPGAAGPIAGAPPGKAQKIAASKHGTTGLGGYELAETAFRAQSVGAAAYITDSLRTQPSSSVTLVAIGPLTNLATALTSAPDIAPRIAEIVIMGGAAREPGNVTPTSETNTYFDPEAARIVYGCGAPMTTMPLDVTHQALVTPARRETLSNLPAPYGAALAGWTDPAGRTDLDRFGGAGAPLHDPCTIAYLIAPDLFLGHQVSIAVETESPLCRGMTIVDWWGVTGREPNATVMTGLNADGFFRLLADRLSSLAAQ